MKNTYLILLFLIFSFFFFDVTAQEIRTCGTTEAINLQKQIDPDFELNRNKIKSEVQNWLNHQTEEIQVIYTIPVVVHIVYKTAAQNIHDSLVHSQIEILNKDFSRTNADTTSTPNGFKSVAGSTNVRFCLADISPTGDTTSGITRTVTTVNSFSLNDDVKFTNNGGINGWDRTKYLNIWVCNLSGSILGYALPPGSSAAIDGVVVGYKYFGKGSISGTFNKGRTATHEVGHWLALEHIWGDDGSDCPGSGGFDDGISDTPAQADENYGCPAFPNVSCSNGTNGDMFMNYMDYTDDACMNLFTKGQANIISAIMNTSRSSLKTSGKCSYSISIKTHESKDNISIFPNPTSGQIKISGVESFQKLEIYSLLGTNVLQHSIDGKLKFEEIDLGKLSNGIYLLKLSNSEKTIVEKLILNQ